LNVRLPALLVRRLKVLAAIAGVPVADLVREALEKRLDDDQQLFDFVTELQTGNPPRTRNESP
jgi:predicted DNA-binding protein